MAWRSPFIVSTGEVAASARTSTASMPRLRRNGASSGCSLSCAATITGFCANSTICLYSSS